jgi:hypothetical protein
VAAEQVWILCGRGNIFLLPVIEHQTPLPTASNLVTILRRYPGFLSAVNEEE